MTKAQIQAAIMRAIHLIHHEDNYDAGMELLCKAAGVKTMKLQTKPVSLAELANMNTAPQICIRLTDSSTAGSCNACNRFSTPNGVLKHDVLEITLKSIGFRLCKQCRLELLQELQEHPIP